MMDSPLVTTQQTGSRNHHRDIEPSGQTQCAQRRPDGSVLDGVRIPRPGSDPARRSSCAAKEWPSARAWIWSKRLRRPAPKTTARLVARLLRAVYQVPQVTIAAVHGAAIAGGAGLMSACDMVVAARDTRIGYPEVKRGLVAALVMTLLRRQVPERDARELLLLGDLISAERAREMGLVNRVVAKGELAHETLVLARKVLLRRTRSNRKHEESAR